MLETLVVAETPPADGPQSLATALVISAFLAAGLATWAWAVSQWRRGRPAILPQRRRPVPWRATEVVLVIGSIVGLTLIGATASSEGDNDATASDVAEMLLASAAIYAALAAMTATFLVVVRRADAGDLGAIPKFPADLFIGFFGWLAALLPVYALQQVLVHVVGADRQQHPLLELLTVDRRVDMLLLAVLSAVVIAPLVEEFLFRVLLQGWLEKAFMPVAARRVRLAPAASDPAASELALSEPAADGDSTSEGGESGPSASGYSTGAGELNEGDERPRSDAFDDRHAIPPYAPPQVEVSSTGYQPARVELAGDERDSPRGWTADEQDLAANDQNAAVEFRGIGGAAPIVISSALFASAHAGTWPDPLPLFLLALVLGYVHRQTHRLWPCVVLHMLFNGLALAMVWFGGDG